MGHEAKVTMTYISRSSDFPYILKTFWYMNTILHCDLYFMVQWFCLISRTLFDVWTSYFRIMSRCDPARDLKNKCRSLWSIFHSPVILPYILKTIWYRNTIRQDYESVWHNIWPQNKCRSLWPIFHGPMILPYISKTVWCMNIILQDYESVWLNMWPQNKCRSLWSIFHGPVILPYFLKTIWYMNTILWYYESVWPDVWPKNKCRSLWPLFQGPVILPYTCILKTIWYMNTILLFYASVWPDVWPKINVGHYDLYFMVQWICLISWKLFSSSTSYFGTMSRYDPMSDLKIFIGHCDLYIMVQRFCLISWRLFGVWTLYFGIMIQCNMTFAPKQCKSLWFIFSWSSDFALYLK